MSRICCVVMGVTSIGAGPMIYGKGDLSCSPTMEWGAIATMLQCNAQHAGYDNVIACHVV